MTLPTKDADRRVPARESDLFLGLHEATGLGSSDASGVHEALWQASHVPVGGDQFAGAGLWGGVGTRWDLGALGPV